MWPDPIRVGSGHMRLNEATVQLTHSNHEASSRIVYHPCLFVLWATFIHAQFCILVGRTGRNVPPSFCPISSFSNSQ